MEIENNNLFLIVNRLIEEAKQQIATSVNSAMAILYWQIGKTINEDILI